MLLKHPTRTQLITYAEALVDGRGPIFSGIARHLTQCPQCSAEVEAICSSLRFLNSAPKIEPPKELALEILKRAREQKKKMEQNTLPVKKHSRVLVTVCVSIWLMTAYILFGVSYNPTLFDNTTGKMSITVQMASPKMQTPVEKSMEKDVWHEIELLGSALSPVFRNNTGYFSRQLRSVSIIDRELESAQTALRKNPNCPRANEILQKGVRQKAELLRQIYLERVL
ncbi:MAG TPA: hypothetical protein PLA12_11805 [Candidatus Hydrogenedens sp.]|nr:hypothetical protein [Candidatus Hydrogenedens sp.]